MNCLRAAAVATLLLAAEQPLAHANGRFPEANQLAVDAADPRHLVVRTTFGILRSFDAGASWTWTCEQAISPLGLLDEELLISTNGRTSVALGNGIATTDRDGCRWTRAQGDVADQRILDLVGDTNDRAVAYAAVNLIINGSFHGRIAKTTDGTSWAFIGDVLSRTVPLTIDIAPSRPNRLYLGVNDGDFEFGYIDVSDDAGLTWTRHAPPAGVDSVYVSGIDPEDANRVYVRQTFPDNALHVSEDGGATWKTIYTAAQPLKGFAIAPDGRRIAVGAADGLTILTRSDAPDGSTSTFAASALHPLTVTCLTWSAAGLYACADDKVDGFTIGLSTDGGTTFHALLRLPDLVPAWCPSDSGVGQSCPRLWCETATKFDASCAPAVMPGSKAPPSGCGCRTAGQGDGGGGGVPVNDLWQALLAIFAIFTILVGVLSRRRSSGRRSFS